MAAGGLTDIITQPGKTGLLYAPGDYAAAAAAVAGIIADPAVKQRLGAAARSEVEKFGWSAATRTLREKQYRRAVRVALGRRRFWWLFLRLWVARLVGSIGGAVGRLFNSLDYARDMRGTPSPGLAAQ